MAEVTDAKGTFGFLGHKAGPLPVGVWLVIGVGVWYYTQKKSAASSSASGSPLTTANTGTDPAGNVGAIDPNTGYVYGTPEDTAALQGQSGVAANTSGTTGANGKYADNSQWGAAAVNYLVGLGDDPTQANQAISLWLSGQSPTSQQQAMVNSAVQALGPPPQLPGPSGTNPGQIVTPPGSGGTSSSPPPVTNPPPPPGVGSPGEGPVPTPVTTPKPPVSRTPARPATPAVHVTGTTSTSVSARWGAVRGATGYVARVTYQSRLVKQASTKSTSITLTGLRPDSSMHLHVYATGPGGRSPETSNSFHTPR